MPTQRKKIAWFSRHVPTPRQLAALRLHFGSNIELSIDKRPFPSASVIVKRLHHTQADEFVIVAPLSIIHALVELGYHPLRAVMLECDAKHPHSEYRTSHRFYRFVKFERITSYKLVTEEPNFQPSEPSSSQVLA